MATTKQPWGLPVLATSMSNFIQNWLKVCVPNMAKVYYGKKMYEADKARPTKDDECVERRATDTLPFHLEYSRSTAHAHGVCYGFEVLRECESPRHPFQIFKTRFSKPPSKII